MTPPPARERWIRLVVAGALVTPGFSTGRSRMEQGSPLNRTAEEGTVIKASQPHHEVDDAEE